MNRLHPVRPAADAVPRPTAPRQHRSVASGPWHRATRKLAPYLLLLPFFLTFVVFLLYPLVLSLILVFHQTWGPTERVYVGLDNLRFLWTQPLFWKSMWNTVIYAASAVLIQVPLSLGLAMLLNREDIRGRAWFRLIFFSPSLVGLVFVAILAWIMFAQRTGVINQLLARVTFGAWDIDFPWLNEFAMPAVILASLWMYVGFNMVYFLAALQNVSSDVREAALVDGAGPWHRFLHVTVPAIKPIATFVILLSLIGSFQLFELPFILFGGGGPNDQVLTPVIYLYQSGFEGSNDLGLASAIGWTLALILFTFALGQKLLGRERH